MAWDLTACPKQRPSKRNCDIPQCFYLVELLWCRYYGFENFVRKTRVAARGLGAARFSVCCKCLELSACQGTQVPRFHEILFLSEVSVLLRTTSPSTDLCFLWVRCGSNPKFESEPESLRESCIFPFKGGSLFNLSLLMFKTGFAGFLSSRSCSTISRKTAVDSSSLNLLRGGILRQLSVEFSMLRGLLSYMHHL